jgi:hypothetical protein
MKFTAHGKQVKRRGEHFADAISEVAAGLIAAAMNAYVAASTHPADLDLSEGLAEK